MALELASFSLISESRILDLAPTEQPAPLATADAARPALQLDEPLDHLAQRLLGGVVEVGVGTHRDVVGGRDGAREGEALSLVQDQLERAAHRGLQRLQVHFAVALHRMAVAGGEQRARPRTPRRIPRAAPPP